MMGGEALGMWNTTIYPIIFHFRCSELTLLSSPTPIPVPLSVPSSSTSIPIIVQSGTGQNNNIVQPFEIQNKALTQTLTFPTGIRVIRAPPPAAVDDPQTNNVVPVRQNAQSSFSVPGSRERSKSGTENPPLIDLTSER